MANGIGSTLRDARSRRKLGLPEVESATKIRLRYLRAMENEEWDVLPGGAYSRAFLRTYASYLGLDGDRIAEDYRQSAERDTTDRPVRVEAVAAGGPVRTNRRLPKRALGLLVSAALVAAIVAVALIGGSGDGGSRGAAKGGGPGPGKEASRDAGSLAEAPARSEVAVLIAASGEVWVCLLDAAGKPLVDGEILEAGAEAGPFHAEGFTAAFGNGEFELTIDGKQADTPPSASPVGYEIDSKGSLTPLEEGERPECT